MKYGHVGRPTKEEVASKKRKKLLKVLLPISIVIVIAIVLVTNNGLTNLMGASVNYCTQTCDQGWTLSSDKKSCYQETNNAYLLGDTDNDNTVTTQDYTTIKNAIDADTKLDYIQQIIYDINGDGEVNNDDIDNFTFASTAAFSNSGLELSCPKNQTKEVEIEGQKATVSVQYKLEANSKNCKVDVNIKKEKSAEEVCKHLESTGASNDTQNKVENTSNNNNNIDKLHVVNLSAADCIIIESKKNGELYYGMIDTGNTNVKTWERINKTMKKMAWYEENNNDDSKQFQLDYLILTHAHTDHIGQAVKVIEEYRPKVLYIKKYSFDDNVSEDNNMGEDRKKLYDDIIKAAKAQKTKIIEVGISKTNKTAYDTAKALKGYINYEPFNIEKHKNFKIGNFSVSLFNLSDEVYNIRSVNKQAKANPKNWPTNWNTDWPISENMNSLAMVLSIKKNEKTINTYLDGDLVKSQYPRNYTTKDNVKVQKSVKEIILYQVAQKYEKIDVYKMPHHGFFNSARLNELKILKPTYIFTTSSQKSITSKTTKCDKNKSCYKAYCSISNVQKYLANNFKTHFKTANLNSINERIILNYNETGDNFMTGGSSWEQEITNEYTQDCGNYPYTDNPKDLLKSADPSKPYILMELVE